MTRPGFWDEIAEQAAQAQPGRHSAARRWHRARPRGAHGGARPRSTQPRNHVIEVAHGGHHQVDPGGWLAATTLLPRRPNLPTLDEIEHRAR